MLSTFLRLPLRITLPLLIAALAFVIYHLASAGRIEPVWIVVALVLVYVLVRTAWRVWQGRTRRDVRQQHLADSRSSSVAPHPHSTRSTTTGNTAGPDLTVPDAAPVQAAVVRPPAITFHDVTKTYGAVQALTDVSFTIPQGQVVALLGPNGAGKTTAISVMLGLRHPTHGQVRLLDLDPHDRRARSRCGIMLQESGVPLALTVSETLDLFRSYYPHPLPQAHIIEMAGLGEVLSSRVGTLSGGQRQRLYFALAACGDPDVLFLDEPTAGLDVEARRSFWEQIRAFVRQGKTILLTTHYLEEADALAERVILIDHGQVRADASPAELKAQVSTHHVSFDVSTPLSAAIFARLPVRQLDLSGSHVSFLTPQLELVLRTLFAEPIEIAHLEITGASLEEAVLHLTQPLQAQKGA